MKEERQIGLTVFRILMCFLIVRSMFLYFPYSELLFGQNGIASYARYLAQLQDYGLEFLKYPFDEQWSARIYLWGVILLSFLYSLGIGKWFTGLALYLALLNLQMRNHLVLDGSDNVIIVTLPLLILAESYRFFSYNWPSFSFERQLLAKHIRQAFTVLIILQICIIYFVTGVVKAGADVWQSGLANYYILQLDEFMGSKWNLLLVKNELFVKSTTYMTLVFEILFPLAILHKTTRYIWLSIGVIFHIGIWVLMKIDVFPWIMIATYFIFITDLEYRRFNAWLIHKLKLFRIGSSFIKYISCLLLISCFTAGNAQGQPIEYHLNKVDSLMKSSPAPAMSVGLVFGSRDTILSIGTADRQKQIANNEHILFEIGSITKTFTTLLLAMEVADGGMRLEDELGQYLAMGEEHIAQSITLKELATHSSGLPMNPKGIKRWKADPTAGFDSLGLVGAITAFKLSSKKRGRHRYSNFGMAVLGAVLSSHWQESYSILVRDLIFKKLGMESAAVLPSKAMVGLNLARGHNKKNKPVEHWQFNALCPAGGIVATPSDMLKYLRFCIDTYQSDTKLSKIWLESHYEGEQQSMALGWFIEHLPKGHKLIWHNGNTNGFASYIGFIPGMQVGLVAVTNSTVAIDDLSRKILNQTIAIRHKL